MNFQCNLIHTIGSDIHPSHMEQLMLMLMVNHNVILSFTTLLMQKFKQPTFIQAILILMCRYETNKTHIINITITAILIIVVVVIVVVVVFINNVR